MLSIRLSNTHIFVLKCIIHIGALAPFLWTYYAAFTDNLGGDPVEAILHFTGIGAFNLLLISLVASPLARKLRQGALVRTRRLIGLYAFFYAVAHFVSYILFELQLEWTLLINEIVDRPYITVGFLAFMILFALAATSTKSIQRRMGSSWQNLHNFVYLAGILIALHYIWSVKSDIVQPMVYWTMLIGLLYFRKEKLLRLKHVKKKTTKTLA